MKGAGDQTEARDRRRFCGGGEESLKANADAKERFAGGYVLLYCWEVTGLGEGGKAMAEMPDTWEDKFLEVQ